MAFSGFGFPVLPGQAAFDATAVLSEGTRQADIGTARAAYGGNPANFATFNAAVRTASIAHYNRLIAAALASGGVTVPGSPAALHDLGA